MGGDLGTPTGANNQNNYQQFSISNNPHKSSVSRAGTIGPSAGVALAAQHQQNLQNNFFSVINNVSGSQISGQNIGTSANQSPRSACTTTGTIEEIKPRSLRFTWSMKTTSSLAPDDIMKYFF